MTALRRLTPAVAALVLAAPAPAGFITSDRGGIVVGNRGVGSISVIDVATNAVNTVDLPAAANTPDPFYIVYSPANNLVFVGDRANNRVVAFDGTTFLPAPVSLPAGPGIFHMWGNVPQNQLWVVNDGAGTANRTVSVFDLVTFQNLATIPIPADLVAQGGQDICDGECEILDLALGPVDLTLLGLNVRLDNCADGPVQVCVSASRGEGLLGDLLCGLTGSPVLNLDPGEIAQIARRAADLLADGSISGRDIGELTSLVNRLARR